MRKINPFLLIGGIVSLFIPIAIALVAYFVAVACFGFIEHYSVVNGATVVQHDITPGTAFLVGLAFIAGCSIPGAFGWLIAEDYKK